MKSELFPAAYSTEELMEEPSTFVHNGTGPQIEHANSVTTNATINLVLTNTRNVNRSLNSDYYSLFIGFDPFGRDHFRVPLERALQQKEYLTDTVAETFPKWTAQTIESIKNMPAIIADEFDAQNKESQGALLAVITDIRPQENGIVIRYHPLSRFPFSRLRENNEDFGIGKMEIYRTHWTIKNIDLIEVLNDLKISIWGGLTDG